MATSPFALTQDPNDPWGWNAWAQAQDPGTYGWRNRRELTAADITPELKADWIARGGRWNPAWDDILANPFDYRGMPETADGSGASGPRKTADISELAGYYSTANARSSGYNNLNAILDAYGNPVAGLGSVTEDRPFMSSDDWVEAALVVGGTLAAGYGLQSLAGLGTAAATEVGAGALAAEAGGTAATIGTGAQTFPVFSTLGEAALGGGGLTSTAGTFGGGLTTGTVGSGFAAGTATGAGVITGGSGLTAGAGALGVTGVPGVLSVAGGAGADLGSLSLGQWAQLGTSLYGLYQGDKMMDMAKNADPFAPYRQGYAQQLSQLMQNPSMVTSLPGYQAGLDQAEQTLIRQSASQGLTGSGTTAAALANLGANYQRTAFNDYLGQLSGLAGAGSTGAQGGMAGYAAGANTQNRSIDNFLKILPALTGG